MATSSQQLSFAIRAVNEASKALKDVGGDIDALSGKAKSGEPKVGGFGKTLGNVGTIAGGIIAAQGLSKVGGLFTSAVGAASDLNEALSKSNTVFKENAKEIEDWAAEGARNFGLAKSEALGAAGSFGNMFTQLGINTDEAAGMSMAITELAADFASFHNADITSVIDAQSAAFRGEYDSLQKFLPLINAATVEQKALEMTGKATTAELTAQDKALAVHALMLEGAGEAAGDFARTSDGLANQQRILSAEWENAKATLGTALMPVMTELLRLVLDHVIPAIEDFADVAGPKIEEFAQDVAKYWENDIEPAIDGLQAAWEELAPVILPIISQIQTTVETMATTIALVLGIIIDLLGGDFSGAWTKAKELVLEQIGFIEDTVGNLDDFISGLIPLVTEAAKNLGSAIGSGIANGAETALNGLLGLVTGIINQLIDAYNGSVGKIPGVANIPRIGGGGGSTSTYGVDPGIANAYGTLNPNGTITPPANGGGALFVPSGQTFTSPITAGLPGGGGGAGGGVTVNVQGSVWSLDELAAELNRRGLVAA